MRQNLVLKKKHQLDYLIWVPYIHLIALFFYFFSLSPFCDCLRRVSFSIICSHMKVVEGALPVGTRVVRAMPNTPCLVGEAAVGFARGAASPVSDSALTSALFKVYCCLLSVLTGRIFVLACCITRLPSFHKADDSYSREFRE